MSNCLFEVDIQPGCISMMLPIKTISEANISEHWTKKSKRHKRQKEIVHIFLNSYRNLINLPCIITITRIAPRKLDFGNLVYSLKWIEDALCEELIPGLKPGRADSDPRINRIYCQEKRKPKEYAIKVTFEFNP